MSSASSAQGSPDDVPQLRLPTEDLTQVIQVAAMLVAALRQRREGADAWHPHEDAARRHDRAADPELRRPSGEDQAHRWARAAAAQWGSDSPAADPALWHQDPEFDLVTHESLSTKTPLWDRAGTFEKRGWTPQEVLAGLDPPSSAEALSEQLRASVPDPRQVGPEERVRVYHEPGVDGRIVISRWEAEAAGEGFPLLRQLSARDEQIAERVLHTFRHGSAEDRARLFQAGEVGQQLAAGTRAPLGALVDAHSLTGAIETAAGQRAAAAIRGCEAFGALHTRVEERLAAGEDLPTVLAPLAGMDVSSARTPAAVAVSRLQPGEHTSTEAARVAAGLDPQQGWDQATGRMLSGQYGPAVDQQLHQQGMNPQQTQTSSSSAEAGVSSLLQRAAYVATEGGVTAPDWLQRTLHVSYREATQACEQLRQYGVLGPAKSGGLSSARLRRDDVDAALGLEVSDQTRSWCRQLHEAAEQAGQTEALSRPELQRRLGVPLGRAEDLLSALAQAGVVEEAGSGSWRSQTSSAEQARALLPEQVRDMAAPTDPSLLAQAAELVTRQQWGSSRMLGRRLGLEPDAVVGLMDELEQHGIVGPADAGGRARPVWAQPGEVPTLLGTTASAGTATSPASRPTPTPPRSTPHRGHEPAGQSQAPRHR